MISTKTFVLMDSSSYKTGVGSVYNYQFHFLISPRFLMDDSNEVQTFKSGYGDRNVSSNTIKIDGEYVISASWGNGAFGVRKIDDLGQFTYVYGDRYVLNNFTYEYANSIAIDRVRKVAYISGSVYNGTAKYDFNGDWENTPTKTFLNTGNFAFQTGWSYDNGLELVGDYLYFTRENASQSVCNRTNVVTMTDDDLTVINKVSDGRYGLAWYDEVNNRLYLINRINGDIWVVINPEKSIADGAKVYNLKTDDIPAFINDIYYKMVIPDISNPNHLWVSNYYGRFAKIDITGILDETSTSPILLYQNPLVYGSHANSYPNYINNYGHTLPNPNGYDYAPISAPDRGWSRQFGWFDMENGLPVSIAQDAIVDGSKLEFDYAPVPVKATSPNGTDYLIVGGYGRDGYQFRTYTIDKATLYTESNVVFGDFKLSNDSNIKSVQVGNLKDWVYIPTGTTFAVHVSNDGGVTWEVYDYNGESIHVFSSTGNTVQVKMLMTGNGKTSSYVNGKDVFPHITIMGNSIEFETNAELFKSLKKGVKGL